MSKQFAVLEVEVLIPLSVSQPLKLGFEKNECSREYLHTIGYPTAGSKKKPGPSL